MNHGNKGAWGTVLKIVITVLSALAAAFGVQACCSV